MSIAVLGDVYTETRRLAIAGSIVAPGDFRLKKLIAPLKKSGEKAPVFTRVAEAVQRVVESDEQSSTVALLELSSLVCSILYTQGSTGIEGALIPIEASSFSARSTQVNARTLKPLLEALTTKGSGRLEQIRAAHEMNLFGDLRLVRPTLQAIDDVYGEIADFVAEKILPTFGKAILGELKSTLDLKGKGGHARRLKLIHRLEPVEARELVKKALEEGSKEVKLMAIECLGDSAEDLSFLLEQSRARAQDVRAAAILALSKIQAPESEALMLKTLDSKDVAMLVRPATENYPSVLLSAARDRVRTALPLLAKQNDKAKQKEEVSRFLVLLQIISGKPTAESDKLLMECLDNSDMLTQIKSDPGGTDIVEQAMHALANSSDNAIKYLIEHRDRLPSDGFGRIFVHARRLLKPAELFKTFSPYLNPSAKKKSPEWNRFEALSECLTGNGGNRWYYRYYRAEDEKSKPLDAQWLDLAISKDIAGIVYANVISKHREATKYLSEKWKAMTASKKSDDAIAIASAMLDCQHPDVSACVLEILRETLKKKSHYDSHYWCRLAGQLPAAALPELEAIMADPKTPPAASDVLLEAIQTIRENANTKSTTT